MKKLLPNERVWTQPNDGSGTLSGTFNVDFDASRGKVRVSKPVVQLFDANETFAGGENPFSGYVAKFTKFTKDSSEAYWALADYLFYAEETDSGLIDESNWVNDGQGNTPSVNNTATDSVVYDDKMLVIDGDDIAAYNGSSWDDSWWQTTKGGTSSEVFKFLHVEDGDLYLLTESGKVFQVDIDGTRIETGEGTLDFSAYNYDFTCVGGTSTRMLIGFSDESNDGGGIIEWDMSPSSTTANRIHQLGVAPKCIANWNDLAIAVMSDGKFKYFDSSSFQNYEGIQLPQIDGVYDEFIHPNGWAIIDDLPHFLIKGTEFIEGRANAFAKDTMTKATFPSAVYCLDPAVGLYPRFALTNNPTGNETHYSQPSVHSVGALFALETSYTKFLASYEIYTENEDSSNNLGVVSYYDRQNTNDAKGWILYNDVERSDTKKSIEVIHRLLAEGNSIRAYYQEYEEDEQTFSGVWATDKTFHISEPVTGIDDKWIGWIKTGNGAGQFLRVESVSDTNTVIVTFKDSNDFVTLNDESSITFMKFRWFGDIDGNTKDFHTLSFPSTATSRKVKVLYELTQVAGTTNELDYSIIDT